MLDADMQIFHKVKSDHDLKVLIQGLIFNFSYDLYSNIF